MRFLLRKRIALAGNGEFNKKESVKDFAIVMSILPVVLVGFAVVTPFFLASAFSRLATKMLSFLF